MGNKKQTSYHVFKKLDLFEKTGIMKSQFFYLLTQEFEVSSQTNFSSFLLPEHRSPLGSWSSPSLSLSFLICTMGRMTIPPTVTHTYTQSGRIQWAKAWKCSHHCWRAGDTEEQPADWFHEQLLRPSPSLSSPSFWVCFCLPRRIVFKSCLQCCNPQERTWALQDK